MICQDKENCSFRPYLEWILFIGIMEILARSMLMWYLLLRN